MPFPSRTSPTSAGLGLVATADLAAGTTVEIFDGPLVKYGQIPASEIRHALLFGGDDWVIPTTDARYINHSCDANCHVSDAREVVTTRPVANGEELTIVYNGATMEEFLTGAQAEFVWNAQWTFECRCGSPKCLGVIDRYVVACPGDSHTPNVRLGITPTRGRGVFAGRRLVAGETFEVCPVIVIPAAQWVTMEKTVLYDYTFGWGADDKDAAIAGGYGSFYNHSYDPNARYDKRFDEVAVRFVALRDIEAGEEIVVNYNGTPDNRAPLWFQAEGADDPAGDKA